MHRFTLFAYLFCLFSCQSPNVYLVAKGVEESVVKNVQNNIQNAGYKVTISEIDIPVHFSEAAISVSPVFANPEMLSDIQSVLRYEGFAFSSVYQLAEGNHKYTKNNIGVYLRGVAYKRIPPVMDADVCNSVSATLEFLPNKVFALEIDEVPELIVFKGVYSQQGDSVQLNFDNGTIQTYSLKSTQIKTFFGFKEADTMKLLSQSTEILPIECRFLTIYG